MKTRSEKEAQQVARANAHRPSFFVHDSRARNSVLALGERGSSLTFGKDHEHALHRPDTLIHCSRMCR
jgi:hypothetical protein